MSVELDLRKIFDKRRQDAPPIDMNTRLADLEMDSLDLVEVLFEIEDKFGIHLAQTNAETAAASFADLCRWIEQQTHVDRKSAGG
jgi:acyl carrier protein